MPSKPLKREKDFIQYTPCLNELFFYAFYGWKAVWQVGVVNDKTVRKLKNDLNIDLSNYSIELRSDGLIHFLESHLTEKQKQQRDIRFDDIQRVSEIVNFYTSVKIENTIGKNRLLFERKRPDGIFQLVMEIHNRKKTLSGVSFRIKTCTDL